MRNYPSYRHVFIVFTVLSVLLLIFVYIYLIENTLTKFYEYNDAKKFIEQSEHLIRNHTQTKLRLEELRKVAGVSTYSSNQLQESLLDDINQLCVNKELLIISFSQPHLYQSSEFNIYTCFFKLEGRFADMAMFLSELENSIKYATVASVKFQTEENVRTKEKRLFLNIYIQTINFL